MNQKKNIQNLKDPQPINRPNPVYVKNDFKNQNQKSTFVNKEKVRDSSALRDILNKTLSENKVFEFKKEEPKMEEIKKETPTPISLNDLKIQKPTNISNLKDRGANAEDMNKLKNLIRETPMPTPEPVKEIPIPAPEPIKPEVKVPTPKGAGIPTLDENQDVGKEPTPSPSSSDKSTSKKSGKIREVPEDVLRKILE